MIKLQILPKFQIFGMECSIKNNKTQIKCLSKSLLPLSVQGTMGNSICHVFPQFGYQVSLVDIAQTALDKALQTITKT